MRKTKNQKLKPGDHEKIRDLYAHQGLTQREIGLRFNISHSHVSRIVHNKTSGVPPDERS